MLKEFEVAYVLVGHSERRELYCESDEQVFDRLLAALDNGLTPIRVWVSHLPNAMPRRPWMWYCAR